MPKTIASEHIEQAVTSPDGMLYFTPRHVYKVFACGVNLYEELLKYAFAEGRGVPVLAAARFAAPLHDGVATTPVEGIRFARAFGRYFQLGKPGGEQMLVNAIKTATHPVLLKALVDSLENASDLGLIDPQGFVSTGANPPLSFIDIRYTGKPNPGPFNTLIHTGRARIGQLEDLARQAQAPDE